MWDPDLLYSCEDSPLPVVMPLHTNTPQINQSETTYLLFNVTKPAYYTHCYSPTPPLSSDPTQYTTINVPTMSANWQRLPVLLLRTPYSLTTSTSTYSTNRSHQICTTFHVKDETMPVSILTWVDSYTDKLTEDRMCYSSPVY